MVEYDPRAILLADRCNKNGRDSQHDKSYEMINGEKK